MFLYSLKKRYDLINNVNLVFDFVFDYRFVGKSFDCLIFLFIKWNFYYLK